MAFSPSEIPPPSYEIWVPGRPVPQPRPRVYSGHAVSDDADSRRAKKVIADAFLARHGRLSLAGPVRLEARFGFGADPGTHVWVTPLPPGGSIPTSDVDNLAKLVMDALQKVAYVSDRQVVRLGSTKW